VPAAGPLFGLKITDQRVIFTSGVDSPKFWEGSKKFWEAKMFDFRGITLFCLGYRLSKHKMTIYAKNMWSELPPGYVCVLHELCSILCNYRIHLYALISRACIKKGGLACNKQLKWSDVFVTPFHYETRSVTKGESFKRKKCCQNFSFQNLRKALTAFPLSTARWRGIWNEWWCYFPLIT